MAARAINRKVLSAVTAGTSLIVDTLGHTHLTLNALFSAGVTAGVVTFEGSPDPAFAGVWDPLGTASFSANANVTVTVSEAHRYVRARITTTVVGGSVTVWISCVGPAAGGWMD